MQPRFGSVAVGQPVEEISEVAFELDDLSALRHMVQDLVVDAGLPPVRAQDVALAVNEVTTNALLHGESPASLRVLRGPRELVFEVSDDGSGFDDQEVGWVAPEPSDPGGRGVWLARQIADGLQVQSDDGFTVRIRVDLVPSLQFTR